MQIPELPKVLPATENEAKQTTTYPSYNCLAKSELIAPPSLSQREEIVIRHIESYETQGIHPIGIIKNGTMLFLAVKANNLLQVQALLVFPQCRSFLTYCLDYATQNHLSEVQRCIAQYLEQER